MNLKLAYGKQGLSLRLPDEWNVTVVEPKYVDAAPDPAQALQRALRSPMDSPPLRELVKPEDRVGIIFSDITRPMPTNVILPQVLAELEHVPAQNVTLFNALGTHRHNSDAELRGMLGDAMVDSYRIVQNDAFDRNTQVALDRTQRGHDIWLNREIVECDLRILLGFIEPHFFAGFSGGGKAVMPGMAGQQTVLANHSEPMVGDPQATWGITWGNPIWEEVREVALQTSPLFLLNVTLNRDNRITGVFAGNLDAAHAAGCDFVRETAMAAVARPFDIVITTNSGYPLDLNLYQSVKGMSAAAQVVREGGAIIVAADCWDGIPEHGLYGRLLQEARNPQHLLDTIRAPGFLKQDQWQAQIQAQIQFRADVYVHSDGLTPQQIESAMLKPCADVVETVDDLRGRYGARARICVLPEGPRTIPYVA